LTFASISDAFSKTINNNLLFLTIFINTTSYLIKIVISITRLKMYDTVIGALSHIAEKRKKITAKEEMISFIKSIWKGINFVQHFLLFFYKFPDTEQAENMDEGGTSVYAKNSQRLQEDPCRSHCFTCQSLPEKMTVLIGLKSVDDETLMNCKEKAAGILGVTAYRSI